METPSSSRRITRSQNLAGSANSAIRNNKLTEISGMMDDSDKGLSKSTQRTVKQDRSVLIDITNDSPIVGLASASLDETPISSVSKQRRSNCYMKTPCSGEALLRGQVKNLLQKVEEEAEISKFCLENCGPPRNGFKLMFNSPAALVAPTPVNTPQILNFSSVEEFESLSSISGSPIQDQLIIPQVMSGIIDDGKKNSESGSEFEKEMMISRTLFLDFSEKSDSSSDCSSVVTYQGIIEVERESQEKMGLVEDDDSSIWSIQVNASTRDDDEEEDEVTQDGAKDDENADENEFYDEEGEEEVDDMLCLDELCEGISNISVNGEKKGAKFMGKHTRFMYNSDDELVNDLEEFDCKEDDSADILRLKGLPTPKGKHVRFEDEED